MLNRGSIFLQPVQLRSKIFSALLNPKMVLSFAKWKVLLVSGVKPRVSFRKIDGQIQPASIGGWISFSEYWTFSDLLPLSEEQLCLAALARTGAGSIAIDVGANLGIFTCRIASLGYPVHAFEPIPETHVRLKQNVDFNGLSSCVHLNRCAVGAVAGVVSFERVDNSPAQNRIAINGGERTTEVPVVSLDDYAKDYLIEFIWFYRESRGISRLERAVGKC